MRTIIETLAPIERAAGDPGEHEAALRIVDWLDAAGPNMHGSKRSSSTTAIRSYTPDCRRLGSARPPPG
ncbi:conserved membrane domain protein [Mycobacterium ulcerans str. Harvey]|uniref:Conserved membrane domain protein n=1 Tax=Mycobacterium ulcerans str. Harvey TaxID=1299332 RepID=A0ABP3AB44_MYCUL|nr:conserved membrane domain protein [Mycobacterium ulcerans str. Harvey]